MLRRRAFGILCVIIIAAIGGATAPAGEDVCDKRECREVANRIKWQMGFSKPCEDFHDYVCGSWSGSKELKPTELKEKAVDDLERLLETARAPVASSLNATNKLILAYKSCVNTGRHKKALKAGIQDILSRYDLGKWPILEKEGHEKGIDTLQEILQKTGPRPVFHYFVDDENGRSPSIVMTSPTNFYVSGIDYPNYDDDNEAEIDASAEHTTSDYTDKQAMFEEAYKTFIVESIYLLRNKPVNRKEADAVADSIISFEKDLSKFAASEKGIRTKMTLREFSRLIPKFAMDKILRKDFEDVGIEITRETMVSVEHLRYYQDAVAFMKKPSNLAALKNYVLWTKIRSIAEAEGTLLHKLYLKYKRSTSIFEDDDEDKIVRPSLACVHQLLKHHIMYSAAASYYSKNKFDEDSKKRVSKMMEFLKSAFKDIVTHNKWMSDKTKAEALSRVSNMTAVIGYPDWMLNTKTLNSLYKFVPRIEKSESFVKHFFWLLENDHKQKLLKLNKRFIKKEFEDVPLRSHAYYNEPRETLVYPAAALATHYRNPPVPRSINFGTIGTIIAQLFTNVIDRFDYIYQDGKRAVSDVWNEDTTRNFCNLSSCLNNTEECKGTADVQSSKHQHLRDYFGVRTAFMALKRSKANYSGPYLLPGKKFNTEEKIFFTAFGNLYCPYSVNEEFLQSRADEPEDLYRDALNEVAYGYKQFNATFKCQDNKEADKCDLMPPDTGINTEGC